MNYVMSEHIHFTLSTELGKRPEYFPTDEYGIENE